MKDVSNLCILKDNISIMSTVQFQLNNSHTHSIWTLEIEGGEWNRMYNMVFRNDPHGIIPLLMDEDEFFMLFERLLNFVIFEMEHLFYVIVASSVRLLSLL